MKSILTYDKSKPLKQETGLDSLFNTNITSIHQQVVDALYEDRELYRQEIAEQLRRKINKYENLTKRKETDYIRSRSNETDVYNRQRVSIDSSIKQLADKKDAIEKDQGQDFDKEAYKRLKDELSERREAKERLLS